jgi:hypothetical protein
MLRGDEMGAMRAATNTHAHAYAIAVGASSMWRREFIGDPRKFKFDAMTAL